MAELLLLKYAYTYNSPLLCLYSSRFYLYFSPGKSFPKAESEAPHSLIAWLGWKEAIHMLNLFSGLLSVVFTFKIPCQQPRKRPIGYILVQKKLSHMLQQAKSGSLEKEALLR